MIRVGLPAAEVAAELVVEDAGADLEQEVGAVWFQRICCFDRALADDLVDRGLGGRGADGLPHLVPLSVPAFRDRQAPGPGGHDEGPGAVPGPSWSPGVAARWSAATARQHRVRSLAGPFAGARGRPGGAECSWLAVPGEWD